MAGAGPATAAVRTGARPRTVIRASCGNPAPNAGQALLSNA